MDRVSCPHAHVARLGRGKWAGSGKVKAALSHDAASDSVLVLICPGCRSAQVGERPGLVEARVKLCRNDVCPYMRTHQLDSIVCRKAARKFP